MNETKERQNKKIQKYPYFLIQIVIPKATQPYIVGKIGLRHNSCNNAFAYGDHEISTSISVTNYNYFNSASCIELCLLGDGCSALLTAMSKNNIRS